MIAVKGNDKANYLADLRNKNPLVIYDTYPPCESFEMAMAGYPTGRVNEENGLRLKEMVSDLPDFDRKRAPELKLLIYGEDIQI